MHMPLVLQATQETIGESTITILGQLTLGVHTPYELVAVPLVVTFRINDIIRKLKITYTK
jgi:hypothetical protein